MYTVSFARSLRLETRPEIHFWKPTAARSGFMYLLTDGWWGRESEGNDGCFSGHFQG